MQSNKQNKNTFDINGHTIVKHYTPNLPRNPKLKDKTKALRKAGILSEVLFWQQVHRKKFYGIDFDRQYIIGNYIVDFYSKALSLVIEIDGQSHDAKGAYDEARQSCLANLGLTIYRIQDKDIKQNIEHVMQQLEDFIVQNYTNTPPCGHPSCQEGNRRAVTKQSNSPSKLKGWQPKADGVDAFYTNTPPCGHPSCQEGNGRAPTKQPNSPSSMYHRQASHKGWQPKAYEVDAFYANTPPCGHPSCQEGNERPTEKHPNSPSKLKGWTRSGRGS